MKTYIPEIPENSRKQEPPITKKELAGFLRVSTRFIEGEVTKGRLRAVKLGPKCVRFRWRDIERYMEAA